MDDEGHFHQARVKILRAEVHEAAQVHEDDLHVVIFNVATHTHIPSELLPAVIVPHHPGHDVELHLSDRNAYRTESNVSEGYKLWHYVSVHQYYMKRRYRSWDLIPRPHEIHPSIVQKIKKPASRCRSLKLTQSRGVVVDDDRQVQ